MANSIVISQMQQVEQFLKGTVNELNDFLNNTTLPNLVDECDASENYVNQLLMTVRRLVVFCDEGHQACQVLLNSEPFRKSAAEKVLYTIFHQCVEEFFSPKNDAWFEDSRAAYTGKDAVQFHETPPRSLQKVIRSLEKNFQTIREELQYYETDYRTKMLQSK